MIPGIFIAVLAEPSVIRLELGVVLFLAFLSAGFIASSNYVLNEILDAEKDAKHPVKCLRPIPMGQVSLSLAYAQWIVLALLGFIVADMINFHFLCMVLFLWVMGGLYNIPPIRTKDKPYLDVLSESVNNPIRLLLGWYAVSTITIPPVSLVFAYWMVGAFFMAVKRLAEYRTINDPKRAEAYRNSFGHYTEERLLISIVYYAVTFGLFMGIFLIRYKMELIFSIPFIAGAIAWYIKIGFKENSCTQYPEKLYKEKSFVGYLILCGVIFVTLLMVHFPWLPAFFEKTIAL
ncbi:MAG: UbiA family prenyltransferase [Desulfobulbaceae bacterium]|nr:UbiA family prenyltransferase [Desulfobulbaceae bacterium]